MLLPARAGIAREEARVRGLRLGCVGWPQIGGAPRLRLELRRRDASRSVRAVGATCARWEQGGGSARARRAQRPRRARLLYEECVRRAPGLHLALGLRRMKDRRHRSRRRLCAAPSLAVGGSFLGRLVRRARWIPGGRIGFRLYLWAARARASGTAVMTVCELGTRGKLTSAKDGRICIVASRGTRWSVSSPRKSPRRWGARPRGPSNATGGELWSQRGPRGLQPVGEC